MQGLLGTTDDQEALALLALVFAHALTMRTDRPFESAFTEMHMEHAFERARAFMKVARERTNG